jgi:ABC-type multidrug transport system ATPase subunit
LPATDTSARVGLRFDEVDKRYGSLFALRRVTLEIFPGEFVALIGPNGAGKSTLLKIAALLIRPNKGAVRFLGVDRADGTGGTGSTGGATGVDGAESDSPARIKSAIGMVAHSTLLYDELTAEENLLFFSRLYGIEHPQHRAQELLAACGLADRATSLVRTFSRGMRQRLAIARALVHAPRLLLFDEPSSGLDLQGRVWFAEVLAALHLDGCTILLSTHARNEVLRMATRAIRLTAGRVESDSGHDGDPQPLLAALQSEN